MTYLNVELWFLRHSKLYFVESGIHGCPWIPTSNVSLGCKSSHEYTSIIYYANIIIIYFVYKDKNKKAILVIRKFSWVFIAYHFEECLSKKSCSLKTHVTHPHFPPTHKCRGCFLKNTNLSFFMIIFIVQSPSNTSLDVWWFANAIGPFAEINFRVSFGTCIHSFELGFGLDVWDEFDLLSHSFISAGVRGLASQVSFQERLPRT